MRKIIDGIAIASGVGVLAIVGGGAYGFFWFQGNKDALMDKAVQQVTKSIKLPSLSSPALPTVAPSKGLNLPKF
tara:strand:- start:5679 stop:5900 length:222 start_codon:yes stop_codon:yes gene_type:complete